MHCPYYDAARCRSCSELPRPYDEQLAAKQRDATSTLAAYAALRWLPPVASAPWRFRNKAKMVVSGTVEAPVFGILDGRGGGVDLSDCPLYPDALAVAFAPLKRFVSLARIAPYDVAARRGELKYLLITHAEDSGALMLRFVLRSREALSRIEKHLPMLLDWLPQARVVSVNLQPEHKAVLEGDEEIVLGPDDSLTVAVNGLPLHLKPRSFFQTNTRVAQALYRQAAAWIDAQAPRTVWDLYCGVGGFALHAARADREVLGVETSAQAVASAERTAAELGLGGVRFIADDATAFALGAARAPELVVVNPPRRGIGAALARWLERSSVRAVVYSSCNPGSLAADLARMPSLAPCEARVFDMFPHTRHVEVATLLVRT